MPQEGILLSIYELCIIWLCYKVIDIWKARYMNALILVGFVKEYIEIYVNKCFTIPNDWSEFEKKNKK